MFWDVETPADSVKDPPNKGPKTQPAGSPTFLHSGEAKLHRLLGPSVGAIAVQQLLNQTFPGPTQKRSSENSYVN